MAKKYINHNDRNYLRLVEVSPKDSEPAYHPPHREYLSAPEWFCAATERFYQALQVVVILAGIVGYGALALLAYGAHMDLRIILVGAVMGLLLCDVAVRVLRSFWGRMLYGA